jgi:hypothetical protein
MSFTSYTYRLRSSGPFPVKAGFKIHTFMAEKSEVTVHEIITSLLSSDDMALQGGEYVSASYSAYPYTLNGEIAFSGQEIKKPDYIEEDSMPGA